MIEIQVSFIISSKNYYIIDFYYHFYQINLHLLPVLSYKKYKKFISKKVISKKINSKFVTKICL